MRQQASPSSASVPMLRIYLRRSKGDGEHQHFSLDTQREGCRRFVRERLAGFGVTIAWEDRVEYIDDDRAGDDFLGRAGFQKLMREAKPSDVIVCRDGSRLGREAIDVTVAIRDLVRDRRTRLFYYYEQREVFMANAIDAAITFVQGTGYQMEVENIRARTREGLRQRVREGRIAGGRCFGYSLRRERDASGRPYTVAVINDAEAAVVRRIFEDYLIGKGIKRIAIELNRDGVPSPSAGRRGTGSWSPSCIQPMLRNPRYRGLYVHGRIKKLRRGGRTEYVRAEPDEIITVEIPEWRIVDEDTWLAAQDRVVQRKTSTFKPGPNCSRLLSGIARCTCGAGIGVCNTKWGTKIVPAYCCSYHHHRGSAVCPVTVRQPVAEAESEFVRQLSEWLKSEPVIERVKAAIKDEVRRQLAATAVDTKKIKRDLEGLRSEQRNLARAVATGGDQIPELLTELRKRNERIRLLEIDLKAAQQTPATAARIEAAALAGFDRLADSFAASPAEARDNLRILYPKGIPFYPEEIAGRKVWAVGETEAHLDGSTLTSDPDGILPNRDLENDHAFRALPKATRRLGPRSSRRLK